MAVFAVGRVAVAQMGQTRGITSRGGAAATATLPYSFASAASILSIVTSA